MLSSLSKKKKMIILFIVSSLVLSAFISIDRLYVDEMINTDPSTDHTDNQLYIQRARTILHGKLLYKDVDTQTPPLINYLLVPPVYFGTSPLAFEIYFSFFIVLSTLAIFHFLSYMDERKAFFSALAFLFIPTTLVVSTFARQDEAIVVFFFLLPLLLLFTNKNRYRYTLFSSIGIWIKMHSIFLIPPVFLKIKGKEMMKHILIISTVSIVTALPFLILTFEQFTWHLKFYFLGRGGELEGISLWRILGSQGYTVPSIVLIGIMMIAFIFIYYLSYKKDFGIWKVVSLTLLLYFIIYPKIHYEYFLMLLAVLIPYLIENKKMIMLAYLISLLSGLTLLIEQRYLDWNVASIHSEIFISLAVIFMVAVDIFIIFIFRHIVTHKTWLDQKPLF